jgi:hypothetical protein
MNKWRVAVFICDGGWRKADADNAAKPQDGGWVQRE